VASDRLSAFPVRRKKPDLSDQFTGSESLVHAFHLQFTARYVEHRIRGIPRMEQHLSRLEGATVRGALLPEPPISLGNMVPMDSKPKRARCSRKYHCSAATPAKQEPSSPRLCASAKNSACARSSPTASPDSENFTCAKASATRRGRISRRRRQCIGRWKCIIGCDRWRLN